MKRTHLVHLWPIGGVSGRDRPPTNQILLTCIVQEVKQRTSSKCCAFKLLSPRDGFTAGAGKSTAVLLVVRSRDRGNVVSLRVCIELAVGG